MGDEIGKHNVAKQGITDDIVGRIRAIAKEMTTLGQAFDCLKVADEIERLRSLLAGVDNLHRKIQIRLDDGEMDEVCDQCEDLWPCVTHVFLHPEED